MNGAKASHSAPTAVGLPGNGSSGNKRRSDVAKLALGALGVVYGDIGTSPLYALKECVSLPHGVTPAPENIYGLLSLVFWAITLVVSVKYILYVMRADNNGEGG
jgi:KUP system potassium uptake protein